MFKDKIIELHPRLFMLHAIPNPNSRIAESAWQLPSKTLPGHQKDLALTNLKNQQDFFKGKITALQDD